jgi:crotonobetainyl-CoA:carnitine CoA-transferase CaiB-like acyl-CoA transferase
VDRDDPPLKGVTVLEFGSMVAGPYGATLLADLGARVIKVEELKGDPLRGTPKHFFSSQRGKESLAVDLKTAAGQDVVHRLVRRADLVHHNMRLGVMERLGMGYEQLRGLKADLIYCHSSGYGNRGEWSRLPAFEPLHSALAGLLARTGGPGQPPLHYLTHMDFGCALTSATAVLAALWHRDRTGEGQYIECPQVGSALLAMADVHLENGVTLESFGVDPEQRGHAATNALYRCSDGWLVIATSCQRDWLDVHQALGLEPNATYTETRTTRFDRSQDGARIQKRIGLLTVAEASSRLGAAGIAHAVPATIDDEQSLLSTHFARSGGIETSSHPEYGSVFAVGDTIRFAGGRREAARGAPALGRDTEAILAEVGLDEDQRARLFETGVVRGDRSAG